MKKSIFLVVLVMSVLMIPACTTTSTDPITTQEEANQALQRVYNEYKSDLILEGSKTYTVVSGDVLNAISRSEYGNGFYFPLIMLASSDVVLDPDLIEPGMVLTIPDLQRNLNDAKARGRIKGFLREIADIEDRRERPLDAEGLRKLSDEL
jgi:hypothetical protein